MPDQPQGAPCRTPDAFAKVVLEAGRWVVYLNVPEWEDDTAPDASPLVNRWQRINDYATEQEARVAAGWFERSANRKVKPPTGF
ncbi:MAG TPA: hypothetical protein ENJ16_02065 [Planctomycetaceae bacterium]|nr:hypothetical protein [Planctomycetaceae bacterium]